MDSVDEKFDEIIKKLDLIYDELVRIRRALERELGIEFGYEYYRRSPIRREVRVFKSLGNELSEFFWITIFFVIISIFLMVFFIYIVPRFLLSG